ncbi:MAG: hypothetical protein QXV17_12490 [Candidatus Micrarchaeaceae archaeon]
MTYARLDIHISFCQAIVLTETKEVVKCGKIEKKKKALISFFSAFGEPIENSDRINWFLGTDLSMVRGVWMQGKALTSTENKSDCLYESKPTQNRCKNFSGAAVFNKSIIDNFFIYIIFIIFNSLEKH